MKSKLWFIVLILIMSCKNSRKVELIDTSVLETVKDDIVTEEIPIEQKINISWNNYDWLTEFDWSLMDGRDYVDPAAEHIYWIGDMTPIVKIYKLNIPQDSDLYQVRLRNEMFYFMYQRDEKDKLYPLENTFYSNILDIRHVPISSRLTLILDGYFYSGQNRVGEQTDPNYPLVGIWGEIPHLTEYRLIDPTGCLYYMDIDKRIPGFAIREGTYLLKQTGERAFETISSFPDGQLRLEFIDDQSMLITPLFTLPDGEEGIVGEVIIYYNPDNPRFRREE